MSHLGLVSTDHLDNRSQNVPLLKFTDDSKSAQKTFSYTHLLFGTPVVITSSYKVEYSQEVCWSPQARTNIQKGQRQMFVKKARATTASYAVHNSTQQARIPTPERSFKSLFLYRRLE